MEDILFDFKKVISKLNSYKLEAMLLNMNFSKYFDLNSCNYIKHSSLQLKQKGYKSIIQLISLFGKKIRNTNFIKNLMNNYGLLLDNQNFIQLLHLKINDTNVEHDDYIVVKQSFIITHLLNDLSFLENIDNSNFINIMQEKEKKDIEYYIKQLSKSKDENSVTFRKICLLAEKNITSPYFISKAIMNKKKIKKYEKEKLKRKYFYFPKNIQYKNGFKKNYR